jgi:hypothetical protein
MISLKWKIFRIANLAQLVGLLVCIAFLLTRFLHDNLSGGFFLQCFLPASWDGLH